MSGRQHPENREDDGFDDEPPPLLEDDSSDDEYDESYNVSRMAEADRNNARERMEVAQSQQNERNLAPASLRAHGQSQDTRPDSAHVHYTVFSDPFYDGPFDSAAGNGSDDEGSLPSLLYASDSEEEHDERLVTEPAESASARPNEEPRTRRPRNNPPNTSQPSAPLNPDGRTPVFQQHFAFSVPDRGILQGFGAPFELIGGDSVGLIFGPGGMRLPPLVQIFQGHGLGDPILQVLQASLNQAGNHSQKACKKGLEAVLVHIQVRDGEVVECPIEAERVPVGAWATRMPCGHWFSSALSEWLGTHHTCPVCRYKLVTEDEEYNARHSISLDSCLAAASAASKNPDDIVYQRLQKARQESQLDNMVEEASSELMMGKKILNTASHQPQVHMDQDWADKMCEEALSELLGDGLDQ